MVRFLFSLLMMANWLLFPAHALAETVRIVALGDSLTAGYGLAPGEGFPAQLQAALRERGHDVEIVDAGVSGDTSAGGLSRLEWSVPAEADGVIVELGANDALRGIPPDLTRQSLDEIIGRLTGRGQAVLLAGMKAPPNMGDDYAGRFDAIYPELAEKHGVILYPFFLEGVAGDLSLNQSDGIHPTAEGIALIVARMMPQVEELLSRIAKKSD